MMLGPANTAGKFETAFLFIVGSAVVLLAVVTICMITFLILYNRRRHPRPTKVKESVLLEVVWTAVPTVLVVVMFYFGWVDFDYIRNPPKDALQIQVVARQWSWLFQYQNGKQSDVLNVPVNRNVELVMTSLDVIHSLFIPAFRIKEDCVPGMKTHLWFNADELGSYEILCTEYCGVGHSHMLSQVVVMPPGDFNRWYQAVEAGKAAEALNLLHSKGCLGCHSTEGSKKIGPTFKGLFGKKETVIRQGVKMQVTVDEAFIKNYILNPNVDIIEGYPPIMPKLPVTEKELDVMVDYLETLE